MKKPLLFALTACLLVIWVVHATIIQDDLRVRGGHITTDTATGAPLQNIAIDAAVGKLSGSVQYGLLADPTFNASATVGGYGVRSKPKVAVGAGHLPYINLFDGTKPDFGSGSGAKVICGFCLDVTGADSLNKGIDVVHGLSWFRDTTTFQKLIRLQSGIEFKGRIVSTSQRASDSDFYVLMDLNGGRVVDTLPAAGSCPGRTYTFVQYSTSAAGNGVIKAAAGEKIDDQDSLCMRSNIGKSQITIVSISTRWVTLYRNEEGTFLAQLTGVSGTVTDTGYYTLGKGFMSLRFRPMTGTSNAATMTLTGADSRVLNAGLDTTYTLQNTVIAYNNGAKVAAVCVMSLANGVVTCQNVSSGFAAWTSSGTKGLAYGIEFTGKMGNKAPTF